jgi:flagellar basal body P-ring formation protein FlgA
MTIQLFVAPIIRPVHCRISPSMVVRAALTLAAFMLAALPVLAAEGPVLRGDVVAKGDVLTLGDLVEGVSDPEASRPLFRAPALGETGTIQASRIAAAAAGIGLKRIETEGRAQVTVTRAVRRAGAPEIEAAVKQALDAQHHVDVRALSILFDGSPALLVAPDLTAPVTVEELIYDRRGRRVSALVSIGRRPGERRASARVTGALVELVEAAVLTRPVSRGETVERSDLSIERKPREALPADVATDPASLAGQVARRALAAGQAIRAGDLDKPNLVARGETVTVVYEVPGMVLTLRARAGQGGGKGDLIAVVNPQSKKVLQAQVVAPGQVSVGGAIPGPLASAMPPARP